MVSGFRKKQSVRENARRIGCRRIQKILRTLKGGHSAKGIHNARKGVKELRALLRLVRCGMAREDYRRFVTRLRKISSSLSASRDAHVMLAAFNKLAAKAGEDLASKSRRQIKQRLVAACRKEDAGIEHPGKTLNVVLQQTRQAFETMELRGSGWDVIGTGLKKSYRNGRRALSRACESGIATDYHEWRKRVKDLFYQGGLLAKMSPKRLKKLTIDLEKIGDCLGEDHDLCLLLESPALSGRGKDGSGDPLAAFRALAENRQQDLRAQAVKLGRMIYKEKPSAFCERLMRD